MYGVIVPSANRATFALTPNSNPNIKPACSSLLPLLVSLVARGHKALEKAYAHIKQLAASNEPSILNKFFLTDDSSRCLFNS